MWARYPCRVRGLGFERNEPPPRTVGFDEKKQVD